MSILRKSEIQKSYVPIHPHLYHLKETFFEDSFLRLIKICSTTGCTKNTVKSFLQENKTGLQMYSFPVFNAKFCDELLEELDNFETSGMAKERPNTMNNYGILLSEMGFDENFLDPLREKYLRPLTTILYPEWGGDQLDSHRAFVVIYEEGGDVDLACHYDNAEVTLNVCLGKEFEGGELFCGSMWDSPPTPLESYAQYQHRRGYGFLHRARQRHGAMPLQSGSRYNLIIWMRSSAIRNKLCPMCGQIPDLVPAIGKGDGFTSTVTDQDVCTTL